MISEAHAEAGQHEDVDLGVAEDPEEVLPQHRRAAGLGVEEVRAEEAVEEQHDLRRGERRQGEQDLEADHQHQPDEQRHAAAASCPGSACMKTVVIRLAAVAMLPTPLTSRPTIQ